MARALTPSSDRRFDFGISEPRYSRSVWST